MKGSALSCLAQDSQRLAPKQNPANSSKQPGIHLGYGGSAAGLTMALLVASELPISVSMPYSHWQLGDARAVAVHFMLGALEFLHASKDLPKA